MRICGRVIAAIVGGYVMSWGLSALVAVLLSSFMMRDEAVVLASMLAFALYLAAVLWAFAARRLWQVWILFAGGGAASLGLAVWMAPLLALAGSAA